MSDQITDILRRTMKAIVDVAPPPDVSPIPFGRRAHRRSPLLAAAGGFLLVLLVGTVTLFVADSETDPAASEVDPSNPVGSTTSPGPTFAVTPGMEEWVDSLGPNAVILLAQDEVGIAAVPEAPPDGCTNPTTEPWTMYVHAPHFEAIASGGSPLISCGLFETRLFLGLDQDLDMSTIYGVLPGQVTDLSVELTGSAPIEVSHVLYSPVLDRTAFIQSIPASRVLDAPRDAPLLAITTPNQPPSTVAVPLETIFGTDTDGGGIVDLDFP